MLDWLSTDLVFSYLLILCRLGAAIMLLPAFSESYFSPRSRLIIALGLSLVVMPSIKPLIPPIPASAIELIILVAKESAIGLFMGLFARIIMSVIHMAGMIISFQIGLSAANMFDPSQGGQGSLIGVFMNFIVVMLIFVTDMHHVFIEGIVQSYNVFSFETYLPIADISEVLSKALSDSFMVAFKISSPHLIVGLLLYLAAGIMGRLMPQMQVFFVIMPVQILLGFAVFVITLSGGMIWFMGYYEESISNFSTQF